MLIGKSVQQAFTKLSDRASVGLFFILAGLWGLLIFYTIVPRLFGQTLPANSNIDISLLTWAFVSLSLLGSSLWIFVQIGYLIIGNRVINKQRKVINDKSHDWSKPIVSIIIPAHNEEAVIKRTISSCLSQTHKNTEVLVICHNCTDNTYLAASQITDKRVRAFDYKTKEAGKGLALDFAVENSAGEYVTVLDSDGTLNDDFISTALPLFGIPDIAAVQGKLLPNNRYHNIITNLLSLEGDLYSIPYMTMKSLIDKRTSLGGTGYLIKKDILLKVGGFKNSLIDDFELSFRLFRNKYRIVFAPLSVSHDERPPELALMLRQRSRWVKGHIDLLKERIPEGSDIMGNIYWINPILMICGLLAVLIVSFGLIYYLVFGMLPYQFSFTPLLLWIGITVAGFFLQLAILIKQHRLSGLNLVGPLALSGMFSQYWYVALIKAFFVKSWSNTKTIHGYVNKKDISRFTEEHKYDRKKSG